MPRLRVLHQRAIRAVCTHGTQCRVAGEQCCCCAVHFGLLCKELQVMSMCPAQARCTARLLRPHTHACYVHRGPTLSSKGGVALYSERRARRAAAGVVPARQWHCCWRGVHVPKRAATASQGAPPYAPSVASQLRSKTCKVGSINIACVM